MDRFSDAIFSPIAFLLPFCSLSIFIPLDKRRKLFRQQGVQGWHFPHLLPIFTFHSHSNISLWARSVHLRAFDLWGHKVRGKHSDAIFTILIQFVQNSHVNGGYVCVCVCVVVGSGLKGRGRMTPKEELAAIFAH